MPRLRVLLVLSALLAAGFLGIGCGSSEDSGSGQGDPPAGASTDAGASARGDEEAGDGKKVAVPARSEGVSFDEARNDGDLTPSESSELTTVIGVIGFDHAGYVAGKTVVVDTTEGEDRQFSCIAAGQFDLDHFQVVVLDDAGTALDC